MRLYANFPAELAISGDIPRMNGDTALYVLKLKIKVYTKVTLHPEKGSPKGELIMRNPSHGGLMLT